jgi:hypothetical protein
MSVPTPRRRLSATASIAVLTLVLAACGTGAAASPPASQAPASPPAVAPTDPGKAIDVDALLGDAAAKDGKLVRVTGNFLSDGTTAQLCAVLLESLPPQCGGGVRLTGEVPADTMAALTTTTEPGLKKMWWGFVTLTGTFRAAGTNGQPTIEITDFTLVEG